MSQRRLRIVLLPVAAVVTAAVICWPLPAETGPPLPAAFKVKRHRNIPYYTGEDAVRTKHRLDIYQPVGKKNATVLFYVHGGAWQFGSKSFRANIGKTFAGQGILTVSINYRLSPPVKHPGHVRDVVRAFDWVKRNIHRYGGNPDDLFICGHSAGAHLVALVALNEKYLAEVGRTSDEITGVIPVSGVYRVGGTSLIFKRVFDPDPETLIDASPALHVDDRQPPFLIIYAEHDLPGLDILAIGLERQLSEHNSPAQLLRVENRTHRTITLRIGAKHDPTTEAILNFISKHSRSAVE
ncbi:MAG: hypothetical protein AMS16_03300 [Planctomycetes bacterium DG_58]|nr:MAG: hypothetical protein AMS16_03300 [Planctomycetes bacterium DG_58]